MCMVSNGVIRLYKVVNTSSSITFIDFGMIPFSLVYHKRLCSIFVAIYVLHFFKCFLKYCNVTSTHHKAQSALKTHAICRHLAFTTNTFKFFVGEEK